MILYMLHNLNGMGVCIRRAWFGRNRALVDHSLRGHHRKHASIAIYWPSLYINEPQSKRHSVFEKIKKTIDGDQLILSSCFFFSLFRPCVRYYQDINGRGKGNAAVQCNCYLFYTNPINLIRICFKWKC